MNYSIGYKIQTAATVLTVLGIVGFLILGAVTIYNGVNADYSTFFNMYGAGKAYDIYAQHKTTEIIKGITIAVTGSLGSWFTGLLVRGFGEFIIDTHNIWQILRNKLK